MVVDKKKEAKEEEIRANKEKKEVEQVAKLAEKESEKEAEKEGKGKAKGKKKVAEGGQAPALSTMDQNSEMVGGSHSGMKRKAVLPELTKEMVTQGTQVIVLVDDDHVTSKELILNVSILDMMEDIDTNATATYTEVTDFLKKVWYLKCNCEIFLIVGLH